MGFFRTSQHQEKMPILNGACPFFSLHERGPLLSHKDIVQQTVTHKTKWKTLKLVAELSTEMYLRIKERELLPCLVLFMCIHFLSSKLYTFTKSCLPLPRGRSLLPWEGKSESSSGSCCAVCSHQPHPQLANTPAHPQACGPMQLSDAALSSQDLHHLLSRSSSFQDHFFLGSHLFYFLIFPAA